MLNVKALVGSSRGLLRDYEPSCEPSFQALVQPPSDNASVTAGAGPGTGSSWSSCSSAAPAGRIRHNRKTQFLRAAGCRAAVTSNKWSTFSGSSGRSISDSASAILFLQMEKFCFQNYSDNHLCNLYAQCWISSIFLWATWSLLSTNSNSHCKL